jgi:hypothetical protein
MSFILPILNVALAAVVIYFTLAANGLNVG